MLGGREDAAVCGHWNRDGGRGTNHSRELAGSAMYLNAKLLKGRFTQIIKIHFLIWLWLCQATQTALVLSLISASIPVEWRGRRFNLQCQ